MPIIPPPPIADMDFVKSYRISQTLLQDEKVVSTLWGTLGAGQTDFYVFNSGGIVFLGKLEQISSAKFKKAFTWDIGNSTNESLFVYAFPKSAEPSEILRSQLERGSVGTDWWPAPEDLQADLQIKTDASILAAKAYADAQDALKKIEAAAYADGIVTVEEARAIADATAKANAAKIAAQNASALDATAKANVASQAAKDYAAAQDAVKKIEAAAYADGIVTAEEARAIADAQAKLNVAKLYADSTAAAAQNASSSYTDSKSVATIAAAQNYADAAANSRASQAKLDAIAIASTTAQGKADVAQANAALLSQQLVDGIKLGGNNLIKGSGISIANSDYMIKNYEISEAIAQGEFVTLTLWGDLGNGKNSFAIYNNLGTIQLAFLELIAVGKYQKTFTWNDLVSGSFNIYTFSSAVTALSSIIKIKLERGNKGSDWSPNPTDVQAAIDLAKSTADIAQLQFNNLTATLAVTAFQDITQWAINGKTLIQGGYINADLIKAAIVEANIVRTGNTGARVEILGSTIKSYHANGVLGREQKIKDGLVTDIWYDINGIETFRIGQTGIVYVDVDNSPDTYNAVTFLAVGVNASGSSSYPAICIAGTGPYSDITLYSSRKTGRWFSDSLGNTVPSDGFYFTSETMFTRIENGYNVGQGDCTNGYTPPLIT